MSSHLTFTSPTAGNERLFGSIGADEFQCLAMALAQRLREGSMPPDDAYWWTRALCAEPAVRDEFLEDQARVA